MITFKQLADIGCVELPEKMDSSIVSGDAKFVFEGFNSGKKQYDNLPIDLTKLLDVEKLAEYLFRKVWTELQFNEASSKLREFYMNEAKAIINNLPDLVKT